MSGTISNFRNFAFPKKKPGTNDAPKSPHLRPFLLNLPREEAMTILNSSRPPKRVDRQSFMQMNVPARDRSSGLVRGPRSDPSNQPKIYVPFAPLPSDLGKLMAPQKHGARCQKCNSNIVLSKVLKENGQPNVFDAHLGETFNVTQGEDDNGAPVAVQMVWACRINRHVFPSAANTTAPATTVRIVDPKTDGPKRLTLASAQRWVNEMQELMRRGDVGRAKECMTEIVLMNEGMKKESFSWLEKEKASRLSASLCLPKKITFQEEKQEKKDELEKPEKPGEGEKLLKEFFDEGATIFQIITGEDINLEYSGLAIDSSSESNLSEMATNVIEEPTEERSTAPDAKAVVIRTQENPSLDDKSAKSTPINSSTSSTTSNASPPQEAENPPTVMSTEDTTTSKRLSKRFSLTNILTGFKKVSPSIKRIEGKHDLSKYAEEQAAAAARITAMLPVQGEPMPLHEMLQEPFHRIAEEPLKDLSRGYRVSSSNISNTSALRLEIMLEPSLANVSGEEIQPDTPSFVTDKSGDVGED
ncbi:uncharacterized protein DFL_001467 [Arthrobotrys flagrans]|uniref:Uncharacterized protein n=1 Tax=Arthrobotrys flagrans TaxID=97331 RepID=A0A437A7Q3_ARTFL|nr:hypothetical protein DFL_001467 [Arthrobotrys flagrans]